MPPKKQNRKKLDLTHLAGLTASIISEPDKPDEPLPSSSTQEPESASENTTADSALKSDRSEPPVPETSTATVEEPVTEEPEVTATPQEELESSDRRQETKKPQRSESRSSNTLASVTNANGEVFKPGDKVLAKSPWGDRVVAEIKTVYEDSEGDTWAQYLPNEEQVPPGWSWLGGCSRAARLLKA